MRFGRSVVRRGTTECIRLDDGSEFTAIAVRAWLDGIGVKTLFIAPGSPWENGYIELFNGKLRDELLDCEIFYTLAEAKILIEGWSKQYNTIRPHRSLGYPAAVSAYRGSAAFEGGHYLVGRSEPPVQHFHEGVVEALGMDPLERL